MDEVSKNRRRLARWVAVLVALVAAALLASQAVGTPTKDVKVDPEAASSATGFTDLDTLTYAQAKTRLDELSSITLPAAIPGLDAIDLSGVRLGSNDAGRSLSLSGSGKLPVLHGGSQSVDLVVTAVWPDAESTEPVLAIAAKTDDLALAEINPLWNDAYGDVNFATARLAISTADQTLDPATLPQSAQEFFPEPVELTGGVNFAGRLELDGRLADAFAYAGYSGDVEVEGSLGASAAALFGKGTDAQLGALHLQATLGKSPTAPAWLADRSSTYAFTLENRQPRLSIDEDLTVTIDGHTNHFKGHVAIAPAGDIEAEIGLVGQLDPPFGLPGSKLSDISLRLKPSEAALSFAVAADGGSPINVSARLGRAGAQFDVDGELTVPRLVALGSSVLGTPATAVPGADDVSLDHVSFSFASGTFSVGAKATVKQQRFDALMTIRGTKPLLSLRLPEPVALSTLLPQAGTTLGALQLPALTFTATPLTELATADMTPQEEDYFGDIYGTLPDTISFAPGLNLEARLPVDALGVSDALGYPAGSEVALSGTLGAGITLSKVNGTSSFALNQLELKAKLPAATNSTILPSWVTPSGPTTLAFKYATGGIAASFATSADVKVGDSTFPTTLSGRLARAGQRTSIGFTGSIGSWSQPYGLSWLNSLNQAKVELDTSFGGGQASTVDAAVTGSAMLGGKNFELELGLTKATSTTAKVTARFNDRARLREIANAFPGVSSAATGGLADLEVGPVAATVIAGGGAGAFELTATTRLQDITSDLLISVRPGGGFSAGIKARGSVDLKRLVRDAPDMKVTLPAAAMVLGNETAARPVAQLSDGEFDFYKTLYGCAADAPRDGCAKFTTLRVTPGLKLLAGFDLGADAKQMTEEIGIQTGGNVMLEGTIPVLGGRDFALRASLGSFRFDEQPDWFDHGDVALEISTDGLRFAGELGVKVVRPEGKCTGTTITTSNGCYDVLNFGIAARLGIRTPSLTLTGSLKTERPWRYAFGQDWLEIKRVALQLGVKLTTGPEVTMGFQGDIKVGSKDVAAALKVGLSPAPPPLFVRPNLIGFSAASTAGLELKDLLWLNEQITGKKVEAGSLPNVSLRNLFLQFSQETDPDLCLTQGLRFNADLYAGSNLVPATPGTDDPNGCRTLDTSPETRQTCLAHKADGCLASVYGRFDSGGLVAGGELNSFDLGPISFDDSSLNLALTATKQQLRIKGGVRIGSDSYEFASGRADLDFSKAGIAFKGDAALFNNAFHGYVEANAAFDLRNPSFMVKAWLRADGRGAMDSLVGPKAERLRPTLVAVGNVLNVISGQGSVPNVSQLPALLRSAGATVPSQVEKMTTVLGEAQAKIRQNGGPALALDPLLKGFSFNAPGTPGYWADSICMGVAVVNGVCYAIPPVPEFGYGGERGYWTPRTCVTTVVNGTCWATPPFGVSVGGICSALGISNWSSDCSWAGLMRLYVRPALLSAFKSVTGVEFDAAGLTALVNRFANGVGSIVSVDCAYFSADASALARGNVDLAVATKLRLFGHPLEFGTAWNFRAAGGSPDEVFKQILKSLISPSSTSCPALPAGHEQVGNDVPSATLKATIAPGAVKGDMRVTATFDDTELKYPAVVVRWGDGSTTTLPAGESRTVSATHTYPNAGNYAAMVVVSDGGAYAQQLTADVANATPELTELTADPAPSDEGGTVTLRGAFTDAGTAAKHTVRVDWGDGSVPETASVATGARSFALPHRYLNQQSRPVKATVIDDGGAKSSRDAQVTVRNVAPSGIAMRPIKVATATGDAETSEATEGALVTYAIDFRDPGELDKHTVTIDWADGTVQTIPVGAGPRRLEVQHRYEDDAALRAKVAVADDDGGRIETNVRVEVRNAVPVVTAKLPDTTRAGKPARLSAMINDAGARDVHTVTIDWGSGVPAAERTQTIALEPGTRSFEVEKSFANAGTYTVKVEANDGKDRGKTVLPLTVTM